MINFKVQLFTVQAFFKSPKVPFFANALSNRACNFKKLPLSSWHYLATLLCCLICSSCGPRYTRHPIILEAEHMLCNNPDSALNLLVTIEHPEQLSMPDYAAWCLHYTHASYKCYSDIQSDSLIRVALNYYNGSKLTTYSGTAYYLSGCVSELLNDTKKAMEYYKHAVNLLQETDEYNTLGLAVINTGYIYKQNELYTEASKQFKKSLEIFLKSGDRRNQISACFELSNMLLQLNAPLDSILYYSNKALDLSRQTNNTALIHRILSRQGEILSYSDSRSAINYLLPGYTNSSNLRERNASFLAYNYSQLGSVDSALFYLKASANEPIDQESSILRNLAHALVYSKLNEYDKAYRYIKQAYFDQDTVFRAKLQSQLYEIDKQFDFAEKEKENAQLKLSIRNKIIAISLLTIGTLSMLLVLLLAVMRHRKKQHALRIHQQQLEFEIKNKELELTQKKQLLLHKLKQRIELTISFNQQIGTNNHKSTNTDIHHRFISQLILSESDWAYYINEIDTLFNNKLSQLKIQYPDLTTTDMILVALSCLGFDIPDTCQLLNINKNTMYTRRKRIKKRLGIDPEDGLAEWVELFMTATYKQNSL